MPSMTVRIKTDASDAKRGLQHMRDAMDYAIFAGVKRASEQLLDDCRPYVPLLTGALRDSGHVQALDEYAFSLVWDAANIKNGYIYAQKQYTETLQHVDGKYAAKWVDRVFQTNPGRYSYLASRFVAVEIAKRLKQAGAK